MAGVREAGVRDGFDTLEQLLPGFVDRGQGVVAEADSDDSEGDGAGYRPPWSLSRGPMPTAAKDSSQPRRQPHIVFISSPEPTCTPNRGTPTRP